MKKILFYVLISLSLTAFNSCQKEQVSVNNQAEELIIQKEATQKGLIACSVYDASGHNICTGTRCGSPTGTCGANYTICKCVKAAIPMGNLPVGMTFEEFQTIWNDDLRRQQLINLGYSSN